jgi:XRE family transcriptional regulator of biofilm formation
MLGARIRQLRINKGLSISELSQRSGVAKSYLSSIERDLKSNPSVHILEKIASVLEIDMQMLMDSQYLKSAPEPADHEWIELAREAVAYLGDIKQLTIIGENGVNISIRADKEQLNEDWLHLIAKAKELGISTEEIRSYILNQQSNKKTFYKTNDITNTT